MRTGFTMIRPRDSHRAEAVGKKGGSRPISRVLSWAAIPLGPASPQDSSDQPGNDAGHVMVPLLGLAPGGVCRAGLLPDSRCALTAPFHPCLIPLRGHRRSAFCCTVRRLAPPRRYLAPCPVEPGLSSARERDAAAWPASFLSVAGNWECRTGNGSSSNASYSPFPIPHSPFPIPHSPFPFPIPDSHRATSAAPP